MKCKCGLGLKSIDLAPHINYWANNKNDIFRAKWLLNSDDELEVISRPEHDVRDFNGKLYYPGHCRFDNDQKREICNVNDPDLTDTLEEKEICLECWNRL